MSFDNIPPKAEVMGWNARHLADYMKWLKLSGCDKVVIKRGITGPQFMQMTENELQVFPCINVPMISKIQTEINRGEEKRGFGQRSKASKYPKQNFVQEEETWESDEFDKESDDDGGVYEEGEDNYICPMDEPEQESESTEANAMSVYGPPPSGTKELPPRPNLVKSRGDDSLLAPIPPERTLRLPQHHKQSPQTKVDSHSNLTHPLSPKMDCDPQKPLRAPSRSGPAIPRFDRNKKPSVPKRDLSKSREGSAHNAPSLSIPKPPLPKGPTPPDHRNRANKFSLPSPPPSQHAKVHSSEPGHTNDMDPRWYAGQVTRHQGEVVLKQVNKEGAFVVRDSSKGLLEQPYTLMVLSQGKVYNIQIRNQGNSYSLGTGLRKTESFPGVKEMISHHTHNPLQLIDGTNRSSGAQSQCCLLHPVGF